jgi:hypothetical protein
MESQLFGLAGIVLATLLIRSPKSMDEQSSQDTLVLATSNIRSKNEGR